MDWLLLSCIASFIIACILACLLYANWRAWKQTNRIAQRDYANRIVRHGDQHPWMDR